MGKYPTSMKMVVRLITEYTYGVRGSDKAVPKQDRLVEPTDVLADSAIIDIVNYI